MLKFTNELSPDALAKALSAVLSTNEINVTVKAEKKTEEIRNGKQYDHS